MLNDMGYIENLKSQAIDCIRTYLASYKPHRTKLIIITYIENGGIDDHRAVLRLTIWVQR